MANDFVSQFEQNIKYSYNCFDRVRIKGYIRKFFFIGAIVNFLRALGFHKLSKGVLRILTDQLNKHIEKEAKKYKIPVVHWESVKGHKTKSKLKYVQKHYARKYKGTGNFVYCIITARENTDTFGSRELTSKKGKYWKLYKCKKMIKVYYVYFHDKALGGPCHLKISSYLPFNCDFYFNGHNAIKLELTKRGIKYKMKDNAFISIEDPAIIEEIAQLLEGRIVLERIQYWMDRFFKFDRGQYSTRSKYLKHDWYFSQVEICSNVIFKSARFCTRLFERVLDKFTRFVLPERICRIFGRRPRRPNTKSTWRVYDNNVCIRHWLRNNSVKMYNKCGNFIRVETTINNPGGLGYKLRKSAIYLRAYLFFGLGCNNRFLSCCANVDLASIDDSQTEKFMKPIEKSNGKKVAAPDLRKNKQLALLKELLKPKYAIDGFKTTDLLAALSEHFRNSAQIRYELQKLIVRGVIIKAKGRNFYRIAADGWKWMWVAICSQQHFQNPINSKTINNQATESCAQPSKIEEAYRLIDLGLSQFTQEVGIAS